MTYDNAQQIQQLLNSSKTILVIGLSTNFKRDSRIVSRHMQREGYRIIPVHPTASEILGEHVYPSIAELPPEVAAQVDILNIFRPAEEVAEIVRSGLPYLPNLKAIWTQKDIVSDEAAQLAEEHNLSIVQDRCIRTQQIYLKFSSAVA